MGWNFALDYSKLNQLALAFKGGITGNNSGKRLTNKYGASLEFADFRQYIPGDDVRRIDWSLYGRSQRLYTKLNRSEVDATINIVVDGSKSMDYGNPHKGLRAMELALSFAYISLKAYDRVSVAVGVKGLENYLAPVHGIQSYNKILRFMENLEFNGTGNLNGSLNSLKKVLKPKQVTLVFSDFLDEEGYQQGINKLIEMKQDVWVFQMASPEEIDPDFKGGLKLLDSETGKAKDVDMDYWTVGAYKEAFNEHSNSIKEFCTNRGINYVFVNSQQNSLEVLHSIKNNVTTGKL
ncbi:DUF58 domain-containing protein [Alkalicella caledoniensis]|uniref:DUF58 domain-containing protein n=1 Tax=Alkalicella caledoniensis TaxID=2731377 RepID=A0A7G9WBR1_ALKCA|nr:DUF58 domain-containing protein [Alkalicella caledoniensis]QNO16123.1 DUF58 domain-containing protein [Alkalicella caledoniensis]